MSNISRGSKTAGLMVYLEGPGKANEHTDPHLVAGHRSVVDPSEVGQRLDRQWALSLAHQIDVPRRSFGTKVMWANTEKINARVAEGATKLEAKSAEKFDAHVWHCSLSLKADEGELSDEKWAAIATDFMKEMGFDDQSDPRPSARWVAVRHGLSAAGNDHIHIAASLVREDGTKVNTYRDQNRSQQACNILEHRYGLHVLTSREEDKGTRGVKPGELEKAKREGLAEPVRVSLERTVRAAATASKTEAEFVRRLRGSGLLVRPRYDKGSVDAGVVGYSVAATPTKAERVAGTKPVWFGGGRLAKDLTLPRLRDEWDQSADARVSADGEWNALRRGAAVTVANGRERARIDPELVARAAQDIEKWNKYLSSIPVDDHAQWARAAGRTSGVFAAWSSRVEITPGPLAAASRALAHSAQVPAHQRAPRVESRLSGGGAALILMQAQIQSSGASQVLLLRQLLRTMDAIADAHRAVGDLARADELVALRSSELETLHSDMSTRFPVREPKTAGGGSTAVIVEQKESAAAPRSPSEQAGAEELSPDVVEAIRISRLVRGEGRPAAAQTVSMEQELDPDVVEALRMSKLVGGTVEQARSAARGDSASVSHRELTEEERQAQRAAEISTRGITEEWGRTPTSEQTQASSGVAGERESNEQER